MHEVAAGRGELNSVLHRTVGFRISKYYNRTAFKVEGIDLECFVSQALVLDCKGLVLDCNPTAYALHEKLVQVQDIIETGVDAESLDIDHGTVIASTSVPSEPIQEVNRRRERRPYSAEQLEVLQNELLLAIRRKN